MAIKRLNTRPSKTLSSEQKAAFALLMFLGIGGVYFGFRSFGANLMRPIQVQIAEFYAGEGFLTEDQRESEELEAAKVSDTDGDGLVDYDELYIYKTSPYLTDSDSDGYDDNQEVFSGNDPNCPVGRDCGVVAASEEANTAGVSPSSILQGAGTSVDLEAVKFDTPKDVTDYFEQINIDEIRKALLAAGMSEEQLDLIDDETLKDYFAGTLEEASESGVFDEVLEEVVAE
ncbi:hypothetical protein HOI18_00965 [Candidatus Uhrbacteria bacterium]|jgi:hypothetical protein|nr:hypothetical protein [Candidatus Uhrbacteria bacterium]